MPTMTLSEALTKARLNGREVSTNKRGWAVIPKKYEDSPTYYRAGIQKALKVSCFYWLNTDIVTAMRFNFAVVTNLK